MTDTNNPFCHQRYNNTAQTVSKEWQKHRYKFGNYNHNPYDNTIKYDKSTQPQ